MDTVADPDIDLPAEVSPPAPLHQPAGLDPVRTIAAVALYFCSLARELALMVAAPDRLDAVVSTGGAGARIAAPGSAVNGWVIPPDEEAEMVRAACPQLG